MKSCLVRGIRKIVRVLRDNGNLPPRRSSLGHCQPNCCVDDSGDGRGLRLGEVPEVRLAVRRLLLLLRPNGKAVLRRPIDGPTDGRRVVSDPAVDACQTLFELCR